MAPAPLVAASFGSPSDHLPAGPGLARPSPLCSPSGPPTSACLAPPQPPAALLTSLYSAPPSPRRRRLPPLRLRLRLQVCPPLPSATSAPPRSPPPAGSAPPSTFDSLRLRPPVPSSPSRLLRRIAAPASYPNPAASTSAAAPQAQKQQRRLRVLYTIPVWGSRRRWWCAACCSTACSWSPSCSPATSASYPSPPPPSSRPSPTSPASASCWEWEARWIHSVDNHMGQNNMMRSVVDSWSFRVRFTSVPYQVSASPKYCPPTGSWFWSDIDTPQSAVLVPGSWFRPWQQRRNWHGCSRQVLKDVNTYLRLAIPSTFMTCLEYWTFEMVVLLAGFLPNQKLETSILSISLNTMWMVYTIPSGLSSAISIRVSNELGAGNPQAAGLSVLISGIMCLTEGLLVAIITVLVRDIWGYLYSNEEEVVKYVSTMMPILATSNFMDGMQCTLSGAARGCGWQKVCSLINLCAYYAIGIPSAVIFAFVLKIGGKGLWLGIICAMAVQILALVVMMLRTSWDKEAEKARARTRVQGSDGSITLA